MLSIVIAFGKKRYLINVFTSARKEFLGHKNINITLKYIRIANS